MKNRLLIAAALAALLCGTGWADATIPTAKTNSAWWMGVHASITEDLETFSPDILFMGDSITDGWDSDLDDYPDSSGLVVWTNYYVPRQVYNAGIAGDKIENLLWRVQNGIFSNSIDPDAVVLMLGANNAGDSDTNMAAGLKLIVDEVLARTATSEIIMLGTFPKTWAETRPDLYAAVDDWPPNPRVHVLNINSAFLDPDGTLNDTLYFDGIHLSPAGYEVWQAEMEPLLSELLGLGRDSDGDGLPDTWEMEHGSGVVHIAADDNPDNDAYDNLDEYIAGLDPDTEDRFEIQSMNAADGVLQWAAVSGRVYSVHWTPDLMQPFTPMASNLTAGVFTDTVHQAESDGFYQLKVQVAP